MKRAGFTMIELIFVIVILGILSAVALPKFVGVSEQATLGKAKAYIGTLNRTVAPAIWSDSIAQGDNGDVATGGGSSGSGVTATDMDAQIEVPDVGDTTATKLGSFALALCGGTSANSATISTTALGTADTTGVAAATTFVVGGTTYEIACSNGDASTAPRFWLRENGTNILIAK